MELILVKNYTMKKEVIFSIVITLIFVFLSNTLYSQDSVNVWSLNECIEYALQQNLTVQKSELSKEISIENLEQAKANRYPSLSASVY